MATYTYPFKPCSLNSSHGSHNIPPLPEPSGRAPAEIWRFAATITTTDACIFPDISYLDPDYINYDDGPESGDDPVVFETGCPAMISASHE